MALDLADYHRQTERAVKTFWSSRDKATKKQAQKGALDRDGRTGVTAGKNMNGFIPLIEDLVRKNGLKNADIHQSKTVLTLPGYFRPTKIWDIIVTYQERLIAAIELKSQVGPSFGNNFNNRTEEALGTAHDFWIAYREGAFGEQTRPFTAWLILVEDTVGSRKPVSNVEPHFSVFPEFNGASYLDRYEILCRRMMQEQLYTAASLVASDRTKAKSGTYSCLSDMTHIKSLVAAFAGHIAAEAAK
ncbi:MAG: PaeR7I family type II restriction endonuclease [Bacteroidota bacterium]